MLRSTEKQHERRSVTTSNSHTLFLAHIHDVVCCSQPHTQHGRTAANTRSRFECQSRYTLHVHNVRVYLCVCVSRCRHHDSIAVSFTRTQMPLAEQVTYFSSVSIWHARFSNNFIRSVCVHAVASPTVYRTFSFYFHFGEYGGTLIQCIGRTPTIQKINTILFYGFLLRPHTFACILMAQREYFIRKY